MENSRRTSRWRELPPTLPPECAQLVTDLRELKARSGLNLAELAEATAISKSSWERYLNGKQFPPRHAVAALCRVVGETEVGEGDSGILAGWAVADAAWSGREHGIAADHLRSNPTADRSAPARSDDSAPCRHPGPLHRALLAASVFITRRPRTATAGVLLACAAMITPAAVYHMSHSAARASRARPPVCRLGSCEGRNPRTTACEDPITVASHTADDGTRLEIRLSPSCQAGWIRTRPTHRGFRIEITGPGGHRQSAVVTTLPSDQELGLVTTAMVAAAHPSRLRACYYPSVHQPGRECFDGAAAPR
ncbi:helix-turn-helix domain-containing protein [Streptomyces melanosporofaciens]|uniref:helix-turn-helix domain-containing protein n=1 Tax=unclassified Streptomyces TaxID=2593676 RepID=UPI003687BF78